MYFMSMFPFTSRNSNTSIVKQRKKIRHLTILPQPINSFTILTLSSQTKLSRKIKSYSQIPEAMVSNTMRWLWGLVLFLGIMGIRGQDVGSLISKAVFEDMLKHRNDANCPANGFYTYEAFIDATKAFGAFGTTGDPDTRKREIAAFLAQTSHETTGDHTHFCV